MRALIEEEDGHVGGDILDRAVRQAETDLAVAIRRADAPVLMPRGSCLFCAAELDWPLRWCPIEQDEDPDHACVRMWEREMERRRANT